MFMEIALYKALMEAGIKPDTAEQVVKSVEAEIEKQLQSHTNHLATKSDIALVKADVAEAKTDIIRWMVTTMLASAGLFAAISKLLH